MPRVRNRRNQLGFTLVELLTVIGIIGVLIAILLPAVGAMRRSANKLKTQGIFNATSAALEAYRNATGEPYPPSGSDHPDSLRITNPYSFPNSNAPGLVAVTGANMLVYALAGADLLGTAAFNDIPRSADDDDPGFWNNLDNIQDCINGNHGLYALQYEIACGDGTSDPWRRRFGPFIDIDKTDITTMGDYAEDVLLPKNSPDQSIPTATAMLGVWGAYVDQPFILDGFGFPILYYKADVGASRMVPDRSDDFINHTPGVYDVVDNALYTGLLQEGSTFMGMGNAGMDLGAGRAHQLSEMASPSSRPSNDTGDDGNVQGNPRFDGSLARFVWNRKVTARNVPVNKDTYLLISPGPDALWGTNDDITNFNQ